MMRVSTGKGEETMDQKNSNRLAGAITIGVIGLVIYLVSGEGYDCDSRTALTQMERLIIDPLNKKGATNELVLKDIVHVHRTKEGNTHCEANMTLFRDEESISFPIEYTIYKAEGRWALSTDISDKATIGQVAGWNILIAQIRNQ